MSHVVHNSYIRGQQYDKWKWNASAVAAEEAKMFSKPQRVGNNVSKFKAKSCFLPQMIHAVFMYCLIHMITILCNTIHESGVTVWKEHQRDILACDHLPQLTRAPCVVHPSRPGVLNVNTLRLFFQMNNYDSQKLGILLVLLLYLRIWRRLRNSRLQLYMVSIEIRNSIVLNFKKNKKQNVRNNRFNIMLKVPIYCIAEI